MAWSVSEIRDWVAKPERTVKRVARKQPPSKKEPRIKKEPRKRKGRRISVTGGLVAGVAGGLVATWMLERYHEGTLRSSAAAGADAATLRRKQEELRELERSRGDAAHHVAKAVFGNRLSRHQRERLAPVVPYAVGALVGAVYGVSAELVPLVRTGYGTGFAGLLFLGGPDPVLPWFTGGSSLKKMPSEPSSGTITPQLFYGGVLETVRRVVRWMI